MDEKSLRKTQISTALNVRKLLSRLNLDLSINEPYKDWLQALKALEKLNLKILLPKDKVLLEETVSGSFEKLYDNLEFYEPQAIEILNSCIPIIAKLEIISSDFLKNLNKLP